MLDVARSQFGQLALQLLSFLVVHDWIPCKALAGVNTARQARACRSPPHEALSSTQGPINRDEEGDAATFGTVGHDTNGLPFGIDQDAARVPKVIGVSVCKDVSARKLLSSRLALMIPALTL